MVTRSDPPITNEERLDALTRGRASWREGGLSCPWPRERGYKFQSVSRRTPRDTPGLHHRSDGPESVTEEEIKSWISADPMIRLALRPKVQRALVYLERFRPRTP